MAFESLSLEALGNLDCGRTVGPQRVLQSLGIDSPDYVSLSTNSKSGELFFFSHDRQFVIKTVGSKEYSVLSRLIPAYQDHIQQVPRSMIVRFAGLFCLELLGAKPVYFIVMTSVFDPSCPVQQIYDLKGSSHKRKKKEGESVGKDEDWIASGQKLKVSAAMRRQLCAIHEQDAMLLARFRIMDYSILVGIHVVGDSEGRGKAWRLPATAGLSSGIFAEDGSALYFLGIIDFSIKYGLKKQTETLVNVVRGVSDDASCVAADTYAQRQAQFLRHQLFAEAAEPEADDSSTFGTYGMLLIEISAGHDLVAADWEGTSDPYVRVTLGLLSTRTQTIKCNCNPSWDAKLRLPVNESHTEASVELAVWDEDVSRMLRGSDDFLGRLKVQMADVLREPLELHREALTDAKHGQLSARLSFIPGPLISASDREGMGVDSNSLDSI
jgi:1-phosphatidylinositol-4-phosphate 5-kinase